MKASTLLRGLAIATLALTTIGYWLATRTSPWDIALYLGVWLWSVTVPGVLMQRLLRTPKDRFDDLVVGSVLGLVLQLVAWALFTALGVQHYLLAWPLIVVLPLLTIPGLRRRWRLARFTTSLHPATLWGFVCATALPLGAVGTQLMARSHLPDRAGAWYQDDYWHLALTAQTMRSLPPDVPQVAGEPFFYHWFANAHVGAMALSTSIDLPVVFARLWMPPIVLLGLAMMVLVGRQLSGRTWPGVLAAGTAGLSAAIWPTWFTLFGTGAFNVHSPSQQFAVPIALLAMLPLTAIARTGHMRRGEWTLLTLALVGAAGAKTSVLPVLLCGVLLATVVSAFVSRRLLPGLCRATALVGGVTLASLPLSSGGSAGVKIQLFSTIRGTAPWALMLGGSPPVSLEPILPGLKVAGAGVLLCLVLLSYVMAYGWMLAAVPAFSRTDMSSWFLLGIGIAGWCAMMLINQDGFSQVYFMNSAILGWHLLAAWGMSIGWGAAVAALGASRAGLLVVSAVPTGVLITVMAKAVSGPRPEPGSINSTIVTGLAAAGTPFLLLLLGWLLARWRRNAAWAAALWLFATGCLYGAALPQPTARRISEHLTGSSDLMWWTLVIVAVASLITMVTHRVSGRALTAGATGVLMVSSLMLATVFVDDARTISQRDSPDKPSTVTSSEMRAARWLRDNSGTDDVVATNVYCIGKVTTNLCDARSFWVGAFTERRIFLEGWAYTAQAHEANGVGGRRYVNQPFHDPERFALNRRAFEDPTPERLTALKARGVVWLFADASAGPIAKDLSTLTDETYAEGPVKVLRLR